jgi:hypothetical protein
MLARKLRRAVSKKSGIEFVGNYGGFLSSRVTHEFDYGGLLENGIAATPAIGDLVVFGSTNNATADRTFTAETGGWTKLFDLYANSTYDTNFAVWYKYMSTAVDEIFAYNAGTSIQSNNIVYVFRGVDNATPLDVTPTSSTSASTGIPDSPSITTVTDNSLVIALGACTANGGLADLTAPSGMENGRSHGGAFNKVGGATVLRPVAGAYNPATFGGGEAGSANSMAAVTIALRAA